MTLNIRLIKPLDALLSLDQLLNGDLNCGLPSETRKKLEEVLVGGKPVIDNSNLGTSIFSQLEPHFLQGSRLRAYRFNSMIVCWRLIVVARNAVQGLLFVIGAVGLDTDEHDLLAPSAGAKRLHLKSVDVLIGVCQEKLLIILRLLVL